MIYDSLEQLNDGVRGILEIDDNRVKISDGDKLRQTLIDDLVYSAVFSPSVDVRDAARWLIRRTASTLDILPASIHNLYRAMGKGEVSGFTVPAMNLRGLTYESAQAVFRVALKGKVGPFIFEIARSEIGYTEQRPSEYAAVITGAAVKTGYRGPLFLQGDHFQVSAKRFAVEPEKELGAVSALVEEAIEAGFYNIDIDSSTVVDLSKPTILEQQRNNFCIAADMTALIRQREPDGITVSVGGEIGEVGGKNSTVEELEAFMEGYLDELAKKGKGLEGISKISVQTGTSHGGVVLPDGTIARVKIDFDTLERLSRVARERFGLAGAVQHGASTLPDEAFDKFPRTGTAEIHLATGFQNIIFDSPSFPEALRNKIYDYLRTNLAEERNPKDTEEQFVYKTRKKAFGPFKEEMWNLPPSILREIGRELETKFAFLFEKLNVLNTQDRVSKYVTAPDVPVAAPAALKGGKTPGSERRAVPPAAADRYDEGE